MDPSIELDNSYEALKGLEGLYEINRKGCVRNIKTKRVKAWEITAKGYCRVDLPIDGKWRHMRVGRLVAILFIPNPGNLPEVDHHSGVRTDNSVDNLR